MKISNPNETHSAVPALPTLGETDWNEGVCCESEPSIGSLSAPGGWTAPVVATDLDDDEEDEDFLDEDEDVAIEPSSQPADFDEFEDFDEEDFDDDFDDDFEEELDDDYEIEIEDELSNFEKEADSDDSEGLDEEFD